MRVVSLVGLISMCCQCQSFPCNMPSVVQPLRVKSRGKACHALSCGNGRCWTEDEGGDGLRCPFRRVVVEEELCAYCGLDSCFCAESGSDSGDTGAFPLVPDGPATVFGSIECE